MNEKGAVQGEDMNMNPKRLMILLCTTVFVFGSVNVNAQAFGDPVQPDFDRIDRYIKEQMADCRIPGFSLGIIKDGELLYMKGYGQADSTGRDVTPQTPFIIGSVSKTFTVRMLLNHTSGIETEAE